MIKKSMSILLSSTIFFTGALNNNIFADSNSDYDMQSNETNRIFDNTLNSENPQLYSVVNPGGSNGWQYKYSQKENVYLTTLTMAGVTGALAAATAKYFPVATGALSTIAGTIIGSRLQRVYIKGDYYVRYSNGYIKDQEWRIYYYSNSNYSKRIGKYLKITRNVATGKYTRSWH